MGSDGNACTRIAPCRTLQRGINATGAGRELQILDPGEFGTTTIGKSITISAVGVSATVRNLGAGAAVTIDNAGARVVLRGLFLSGGGSGATGLNIGNAAAVYLEGCTVERFTGNGILYNNLGTRLFVSDTISRDNGGAGLVFISTGAGRLVVKRSRFENNGGDGLSVNESESSIAGSVFSGNAFDGIAQSDGRMNVVSSVAAGNGSRGSSVGFGGEMSLESVVSRGNGISGFTVFMGATGRVSNSVLTNNVVGIQNAGTVQTRGNNSVIGNNTDVLNPAALVGIADE
jgi:hypothetical protein